MYYSIFLPEFCKQRNSDIHGSEACNNQFQELIKISEINFFSIRRRKYCTHRVFIYRTTLVLKEYSDYVFSYLCQYN
jgi:hypothetical protein